MEFLGTQYIVELNQCNAQILDDPERIGQIMLEAAKAAKATIIQQFFHHFSPHGVSGTIVIAESHINIHTWPEHQYAAVDIFTCGDSLDANKAISVLESKLTAKNCTISEIRRGHIR